MSEQPRPRIVGYDLARAIAIFGMVVHHFVIAMAADEKHPPWLGRLLDFFDGRPAALFLILAGVGLSLRSGKARHSEDAAAMAREQQVIARRGILLLIIGFLNLVIWPGDILRVYGISMLLAACLIDASNWRLLATSCSFVVGFLLLFLTVNYETNWDWSTMTYHHLWTVSGAIRNLFYDGFRAVFPWSGYLFFGTWLGRQDLSTPATNRRVLRAGLLVFLAAEAASLVCVYLMTVGREMETQQREAIRYLFGTGSMPPLPLFLAAAGGLAVAAICLSVRIAARWPDSFVVKALVATGQMALSWYFLHIYLGLGAVIAFGLTGNQSLLVATLSGIGFFVVATILSWWWKQFLAHGPLEWLMRRAVG